MRNPDMATCTITLDELTQDAAVAHQVRREAAAHLGVAMTVVCDVQTKQRGTTIVRDSIIT
jgi:uncharacterized protein (UPF0147 family)